MYMQSRDHGSEMGRAAKVMMVALAVLVAGIVTPALAKADLTDQTITDAIEDEYIFDLGVPSNKIDVKVTSGIATLTGTVDNILAKERAARIAETVKGVRSVVNRIKIKPLKERSDSDIERDVRAALLSDPATESYEVAVSVEDGVVMLTGTVESWTEKELCATVAKGVKGVLEVNNQITVEYESDRSDPEIKAEIEKALQWNTLVDDALVDVNVNDGAVTLSGTVGSAAEKRRARSDAWVSGVKSVDASALEVERWARDEDLRQRKYVNKPPSEIENALKDALLYDPRVMSFNVTPQVIGSTATLRGTVDNLKAKRAAEQVARNTVGVRYVTNRLKVRPTEERSDAEIAMNIESAMLRDPYVESHQVTVNVIDGMAYLNGTVDSYYEKAKADDVASKVNGVIAVRNNLDVDYDKRPMVYDPYLYDPYPYGYDWYDYEPAPTYQTDAQIKEEINDELWWSPFVDEDDVMVTVEDGVAVLTGTVGSWSEYDAATENAYEGGATWVDNDLRIE